MVEKKPPSYYINNNTPTVLYIGDKKQHLINRDYKINISVLEIGCFTVNKCHNHCRDNQTSEYIFLIRISALCITTVFCCLVN